VFKVVTILEWVVERYCKGFCRLDLVKLLVEHGADITYFAPQQRTRTSNMLGLAIERHNATLVGYFITTLKSALQYSLPDRGVFPLRRALLVGNPETVLAVLKAGTSPNLGHAIHHQCCRTALGQAVYRQGNTENREKILEYLI
jgi:hypothetical protein